MVSNDMGSDLDQDILFIDELISNYMNDMQERTRPVAHLLKETLDNSKIKKKIGEELRNEVVSEVTEIEQGFKKVLELSSKYTIGMMLTNYFS